MTKNDARKGDQSAEQYKEAPDHMPGEKEPFENEEAVGGAPRGYASDEERYDEDGNRVYREDDEKTGS